MDKAVTIVVCGFVKIRLPPSHYLLDLDFVCVRRICSFQVVVFIFSSI